MLQRVCHFAWVRFPPPQPSAPDSRGTRGQRDADLLVKNQFADPGERKQCHRCSLKTLRLWINLSPSALSAVIRGTTGSQLMAGFSAAALHVQSSSMLSNNESMFAV